MWGRDKQRVKDLERDNEALDQAHTDLKDLNVKLNDRVTVLKRQLAHADQGRAEAMERAYDYSQQIERIARWFQDNAPKKIGEGGAVDNAIRQLDEVLRLERDLVDYAGSLDMLQTKLAKAEDARGTLSAEIKQLRIEIQTLTKDATTPITSATSTIDPELDVKIDPAVMAQVEDAVKQHDEHPETFVKRGRPQRKS